MHAPRALNCWQKISVTRRWGRLLREGPFENIWIQPAAGDAGGSLGAALFTWYQLLENPREASPYDSQKGSLLGPRSTSNDIERFLREQGAGFATFRHETDLLVEVTRLLTAGKVVGWFHGPLEFAPQEYGAHSKLG